MQLTDTQTAEKLGLTAQEFQEICTILGRVPNFTELAIYSVMWSEHCSYKNSIVWLKTLPRESEKMLAKAGEENAGLVDIGGGLACCFKIESHNHPSAIEPYQGAATGVGGIHRDIFTMGARPVAALNSLRFGDLQLPKTRHLLKGVVKGIGDYGNAFGVPTVAGEVYFDSCYNTNPLVNAMSVGLVEVGKTISAISYGAGNPVFIVGSATGKDGIAGAAFASKDIGEDAAKDLPSVQVGDPFQEKLLLEASLEAIATGLIVGMQDMGAAGITCSTCEMSAKGEHGMKIYLDKVPVRQQNMKDWEILLSESQERMLVVVQKGKEQPIRDIFEKWDLNCVQIGEVVEGDFIEYYMHHELVAKVPAESLVLGGGAPQYQREYEKPTYVDDLEKFAIQKISEPENLLPIAQKITALPNIASKAWIFRQYDSMVGIDNTSTNCPSDAALVRIKNTDKSLALTVDCNSRYVYANPYKGAMIAVAEAARNIVCSGAKPMAVTNNLNFGNPYNKHVYWQFVEAVKGMGEACRKFDTPVTGGNVSFYNQSTFDGPVFPTPTIGMLGLLEKNELQLSLAFKENGDTIYLLGEPQNCIASSEYLYHILGEKNSPCPYFDIDAEQHLQSVLLLLNEKGLLQSAHDLSEGGLWIAVLESAMAGNFGVEVYSDENFRKDAYWFGEAQSRVVVSVAEEKRADFERTLAVQNLYHSKIGWVRPQVVSIDKQDWGKIADWKKIYEESLSAKMNTTVETV